MKQEFKYQLLIYGSNGKVYEHFEEKEKEAEALQLKLVTEPVRLGNAAYSPQNIVKVTITKMEK